MTNTRVPGSQRFAHISVPSLDELKYLVDKLNGVQLKGKSIRVAKVHIFFTVLIHSFLQIPQYSAAVDFSQFI